MILQDLFAEEYAARAAVLEYARGMSEALGLPVEMLVRACEAVHPGRPMTQQHLRATGKAITRAGALAAGRDPWNRGGE